jgi:ribonuclease E
MRKSLVISEQDNIAALLENDRVCEFFVNRGELLLGDIYTCTVENILPGIDAAFVNLGKDKMGFLHANDVPGQGPLKERLVPKQKLLVQITKEPTGHKGPRVSTAISLPGRFLVLVPEERGVSISRRISESRERARLKAVVNLMKPPGVGIIIRTEAKGQGEDELFEDFQQLWDTWQTVVSEAEASIGPLLIYRDQDLLYRVIRDAYSHEVTDIIVDSPDGQKRAQEYLSGWASKNTKVSFHTAEEPLLVAKGIDTEIEAALTDRAELPSGGHLNIQPTEALTVIDVNSGRFTSSRTQAETVRRTNLEAAQEIPRQLRLRNIGGMVIVDFIDMESRKDQQQVLEQFQRALEDDRAKPQIGQLSDLGLVELTRRRQGQSLRELFTHQCSHCTGQGVVAFIEVGPQESRKVVGMKAQDDEAFGKKSNRSRANSVLKSASASGGRIVSTVTNGDETVDVPEEILAQMPEELLDPRDRASGRMRPGAAGFSDEEDESEGEDENEVEVLAGSVASSSSLYEETMIEDDDSDAHSRELTSSISAVEEVFQEIGVGETHRYKEAVIEEVSEDSQEEDEDEEDDEVTEVQVQIAEEADDDEDDENDENVGPTYEPEASPYEAVPSSFSGVFTLNKKPEVEEVSAVVSTTHGTETQWNAETAGIAQSVSIAHEEIPYIDVHGKGDAAVESHGNVTHPSPDLSTIRPNFQLVSRDMSAQDSGHNTAGGEEDAEQLKIAAFTNSDSEGSED